MRVLVALVMAVAGAVAGFACADSPGNPESKPAGAGSQQTRVPGEYLLTLAARAEVRAIADLYGRFGIKGIKDLGNNVFLVTLSEDPGPEMMEKLRGGILTSNRFSPTTYTGPRAAKALGNRFVRDCMRGAMLRALPHARGVSFGIADCAPLRLGSNFRPWRSPRTIS